MTSKATSTSSSRPHPLQETADTFAAKVKSANRPALAYMSLAVDKMNELTERDSKIENDLEHMPYRAFSVVFFDDVNNIAVVEDRIAGRKGEYKYVAALYSAKLGKWYTASSYWHKVELAYMQGIADKNLGPNNQFVLFAERMLTVNTEA